MRPSRSSRPGRRTGRCTPAGRLRLAQGRPGGQIAKSWNYTEFFPLNWGAVADYQAAHRGLYGRYRSFARLMRNARSKDQLLVLDEL